MRCADTGGRVAPSPNMRGIEYPQTSASSTPAGRPSALSAAARLAVSVDLPTPPLPEPTHTTLRTCASAPSGRLERPSRSRSAAFSASESTSKKTFT